MPELSLEGGHVGHRVAELFPFRGDWTAIVVAEIDEPDA
jgi:hypothetical protein